jgi:hypothetical protein
LFHAGDLKIAKSLPEAAALASELQDFRASISEAGYASFGARVGKHDDLVLALALACWHLVGPWRNRVAVTQMRLSSRMPSGFRSSNHLERRILPACARFVSSMATRSAQRSSA